MRSPRGGLEHDLARDLTGAPRRRYNASVVRVAVRCDDNADVSVCDLRLRGSLVTRSGSGGRL